MPQLFLDNVIIICKALHCYVPTQLFLALYMCVFIYGFPLAILRTGFPFVEYCSGSFRPCLQSDY